MSTTQSVIRCVLGCLILAGMLQPRTVWAEFALSGIGGTGGAPHRVDCGESGILVGVIGRSGALIDQVGGLCVKIDPFSGTWVGGVYETPHFGGNGGATFRKICPVGQVIMGIEGNPDRIGGVTVAASLNILCGELGIRDGWSPGGPVIMGVRKILTGGPATQRDYCWDPRGETGLVAPNDSKNAPFKGIWGQIGLGLEGSSGSYVDRVHLVCGSMSQDKTGYRVEFSSSPTNSVPEGTPLRISWRASGVKRELIPDLQYSWELYDDIHRTAPSGVGLLGGMTQPARIQDPCAYALQPCKVLGWGGEVSSGAAVTFNSLPPAAYQLRLTVKPTVFPAIIQSSIESKATTRFTIMPNQFIGTFDKTPPNYQPLWIYGIRPNGELIWYRKDSNASVWQGPKTVGTGWNGFKDVIPAGGNRFFALTQDAKLIWYRHDGFNEGSFAWPGPVEVGSGWTFSRIFSGGQGIVYAIKSDGTLLWYRNNDPANGLRSWQEAKVVGSAWNQFKDVFSTGQGAIYAVRSDGRLVLYQHDGYATGEMKWQKDRVVGTGWNSFKQIIPSSDGVIMGILPDGKLIWHKHLGFTAPSTSSRAVTARIVKGQETWEGPVQIGSGWQDFQKVIALIPDPPAVVR